MKKNYTLKTKVLLFTMLWCGLLLSSIDSIAQNINFTIDTAVDNGTSITETIVVGPDTFILTVFHSGNEELDNLGGGDLIFFHSAIDPLTPHVLSITKNGAPTNFNLNGIDYDTLGAGTISLTNQDGDFISNPTAYPLGAGALTITNPANAIDISQVNINPTDNDDLNDFGFHNINVDIVTACDASFSYNALSYCVNDSDPLATVTGTTGGVFSATPAGLSINTSTGTIDVSASTPNTYTVTYTISGTCSEDVNVTVNALDDASYSYDAASYCVDNADPTPTVIGLAGGVFSSTAGISINASTGTIDVSASTPGVYTVTYTTDGVCPNSSSVSVTVNALDDASFSYDAASYCADDTDPTPTVTGLAGGTFSSGAGLTINASTGVIDVSTSTLGVYTVTYTTAGVCPNASNVSVTIDACALANDECIGAIAVICGETVMGSTVGATDSGDNTSNDVFYSFTDTVDQFVTLSLCNSDYDSYVRVFDDCPQTNQIAFNDDSCGAQSEVTFLASANTTYYIMIEGFGANNGNYEMAVTCIPVAVNDECTGAIAVTCAETVTGSTLNATNSGDNPSNDVFYSFTDTILQDVTLTLCNSSYDTFVRVFDDCPQTNQIAGNDDSANCPGNQSELTFTAQPNVTYYIMIEGFGGNNGDYEMSVDCIPNVPAPGNDLCVNATPLILGVTLTGETTAGATDDSTGNVDDTTCDSFNFHSDVWYTFQAPVSGQATVTTLITGDSDQANVAVYSSTDCTQLDVDSIGCSDGNGGEVLNLTGLTANAIYSVRVWSDGVAAVERRTEGTFDITVTDATLSNSEIDNFQAFNYYPNPVNNELILEAQLTIDNVRVFNLLGQLVITETPNATSKNINMRQLQAGAYFVEVTIGNATKTIRIIRE
jgi:hypothetical protein